MFKINNASSKPLVVGNVRQSQAITTFAIGSIVDFVNHTTMICGTDDWDWWEKKEYRINNINLQNLLEVKYFVKPKVSTSESMWDDLSADLPSVIFPTMMYNPRCQTIEKAGKGNCKLKNEKFICYCDKCHGNRQNEYFPSRFVLVCPKGHIEDFPYSWWVHEAVGKESCDKPSLRMYYVDNKTDMEHLFIECSCCGAKRSMKGIGAPNAFAKYHCTGNRPWLGDKEQCNAHEENKFMQMLVRNESSVYFPCTVSALTIPPWSSKLAKKILAKKVAFESVLGKITESNIDLLINKVYEENPHSDKSLIEELAMTLLKRENESYQSLKSIMEDEYNSILANIDEDKSSDYLSHVEKVPDLFNNIIDKVVAVDRLTVVTALVGFTRLIAPSGYSDENLVPISKDKKPWYPGIEQRGEGIFIKFNQDTLDKWTDGYGDRYIGMSKNLENSFHNKDNFSPQYVFLHTFAHLFIRELSNICGYNIASIKERIYSTYKDGKKMAGVLVYTSTPDADGSLGGLIEQAKEVNMEKVLISMIERGKWCSSDPICYTSKEQGFNALNYAACYACTLLPETSCENRNILLDRCSVCGMPGNEHLGIMNWRKEK